MHKNIPGVYFGVCEKMPGIEPGSLAPEASTILLRQPDPARFNRSSEVTSILH